MEFVGVKAARFLLAILTFIQWASSQTTASSDVVGFLIEEGSPITTISCAEATAGQMIVHTHSEFLFCDYAGSSRVGTACDTEGNVLYNAKILGSASTSLCDSPCISVTVVEDWPDDGATYTVVDCMGVIGLETPVSTLYQNEPTDLPSGCEMSPKKILNAEVTDGYLIVTEAVSTALDDSSDVVGFVVEEGSSITTISCGLADMVVYTHSEFLFCDFPGSSRVGTACDTEGNVLYNTEIQDSASTFECGTPCISVTVVEDWPDDGATYTVVDCMGFIGLETPVSTLYQNEPTDLPSGFTESEAPVSTTDSEPWNRPNEEDDDKREGRRPMVGIIVGAAFAGVGLIIAAIFLGNRIGRKKAESSESGSQPRGSKGSGKGPKSLPRPTVSASRAHGSKEAGRRQENLTMQPTRTENAPAKVQAKSKNSPAEMEAKSKNSSAEMEAKSKNSPAEMEAKSKNSPVEMEARIEENLRAELGTGKDAQGWAGGEINAMPYELDAAPLADAKNK